MAPGYDYGVIVSHLKTQADAQELHPSYSLPFCDTCVRTLSNRQAVQ